MQGRLRSPQLGVPQISLKRNLAVLALLALVAAAPLSAKQEKIAIRLKADAGQTVRTSSTDEISLSIGGESLKLEVKSITATKYKEIDTEGNITTESTEESSSAKINGESVEGGEPDKTTTTTKYSPQGEILSYASSSTEKDESNLGVRLSSAMNVYFAEAPVGPGDKWEHNISADAKSGLRAAKASFEYLSTKPSANQRAPRSPSPTPKLVPVL